MTAQDSERTDTGPARYRVRLPGFVSDDDLGLGDAVTRATSRIGMRPCGNCRRRAATLNRWVTFAGRSRRRQ